MSVSALLPPDIAARAAEPLIAPHLTEKTPPDKRDFSMVSQLNLPLRAFVRAAPAGLQALA